MRERLQRVGWALLLAPVVSLPPAVADDASRRTVLEQKAALVQKVLADSAVVRRVRDSGNEEAKHMLARAMANYVQATAFAREGRFDAGEAAINDAMVQIGKARQLVPDAATRLAEQRARHAQLMESTLGMLASAKRHIEKAAASRADVSLAAGDSGRAAELIASARAMADAGKFEEANRSLAAAEQALLSALARSLDSRTLDYTPRFDTQAEEFTHEAERFASILQLVPKALSDLKPGEAAVRQAQDHVAQALRHRDGAVQLAGRGEIGDALKAIREGAGWLQRALTAAGLVLPGQ